MPPRISRQEKCRRRENDVLEAAQDIVARDGFLGLKMSDLAQSCDISVGTLYTHFESKEDLIVCLATEAWQGRLAALVAILREEGLRQSERLVAAAFADFLFSVHHPGLFAAEQLASTPSVTDAASERRVEDLFNVHEDIVDVLVEGAEIAIEAGEFRVGEDEHTLARSIDRGIWTLMIGNSYIWHMERLWGDGSGDEEGIPDLVRRTTQALFVGLGWISENPRRDIDRIADFCSAQTTT